MSYEIDVFESDTPQVWIGFVEVAPAPECEDEEMSEADGAFTSALLWTDNADDFCNQVEEACDEQQWIVKNISRVAPFEASLWKDHENEDEITMLAKEVEETHKLQFDVLYLFENEANEWDVLEEAITDIGYWNWWAEDFPKSVRVEFGGVQLLSDEPQKGQPARGVVALDFEQPVSFSFLTRNKAVDDLPHNWPDMMHKDKLEDLPNIRYKGELHFNEREFVERVLDGAQRVEVRFGAHPKSEEFFDSPVTLAFWADDIGCVVGAQKMTILNQSGEVALDQVPELHQKWWEYWSEYWEVRGTDRAFPKDYACECTIPVDAELDEDDEDEETNEEAKS